jgi:hypothetical protein
MNKILDFGRILYPKACSSKKSRMEEFDQEKVRLDILQEIS